MLETTLTITSLKTPDEARAFKTLNEEWITRVFAIEEADRVILENPVENIVNRGGDVLMARAGDSIVGCVALVPGEADVFELSKMCVILESRGQGYGRRIIHAAIDRARELGAKSLFLGSSTKLPNAVHLYESVGFKHVSVERIGPMPYVRADVFMELEL
ncbi:GNAT family N-acetyltransferase [Paenibacillus donghaensis]|uniref:GNAT family N-acetyltransferase n=1 Tax=Paenibacillus donghaensis TaxID=414771 RepID=UPI0018833FEF|nr:GNAT family N-acetyltransferase [Paenibacillus donghaensis]MBE9915103.1 GNAT family N-acetyltransferase [Paenibacillus donghaensis]